MRIGLLASELSSLHLSTQRGAWLAAGANFRLFQLIASIFILLFTTSSVVGRPKRRRYCRDQGPCQADENGAGSPGRDHTACSSATQIQLVERIPFDQALYLVLTTLTTVGFGGAPMVGKVGRALLSAGGHVAAWAPAISHPSCGGTALAP